MNSSPRRILGILAAVLLTIAILQPAICRADNKTADSDSLKVSLLTVYPGPEIFNLCGHSAIRIRNTETMPGGASLGLDSVWNFGLFDFNSPNFVYRFVKGETDYMAGGEPFAYFIYPYTQVGRRVVEQELNLTQSEARTLLAGLRKQALPENRQYRYNYVKDNCSTRVAEMIEGVLDTTLVYPSDVAYATVRKEMSHYHEGYPWYQTGIDIALGSMLDKPLDSQTQMFVPLEMMEKMRSAKLADGRQLVISENVVYPGLDDARQAPTPWYLSPLFCFWLVAALGGVVIWYEWRHRRPIRWVNAVWFLLTGLAGGLVAFLVFVSEHYATSPNILIWWLNPLWLVAAVTAWWRGADGFTRIWVLMLGAATTILLILWPFQLQCTNPSLFPLMLLTAALAFSFAILANGSKFKSKGVSSRHRSKKRKK